MRAGIVGVVVAAFAAGTSGEAAGAPGEFVEDDVTVLHILEGEASGDQFGWAVSELADVDGDGAMELIVGAPTNDASGMSSGSTYVYSGATGALLFTFTGEVAGALHGYAMADAGDVDGDGIHDIVAGAPGGGGRAYVYSGADGSLVHAIASEGESDFFGAAVAGAGDVDGDGRADLMIGAPNFPSVGDDGGRVYLVSGATGDTLWTIDAEAAGDKLGSATASLGDVNGDGIPDLLAGARDAGPSQGGRVYVISGADGTVVQPVIEADETGGDLAWFFVAGLGDVDGDGVPDIYAGDFANSAQGPATGRAYVYSGATHAPLYVFTGAAPGEGLGPGRRGGDQNGDGVPDVVACSYSSNLGASGAGQASLFSGADGALLRTITSAREGETFGFDAVAVGDVNGDGMDDLAVSGATLDVVYILSGSAEVEGETDGGTGTTGTSSTGTTGDGTTGDVTLTGDTVDPTSAGTTAGDDSSMTGDTSTTGTGGEGCGCRTRRGRRGEWSVVGLLLFTVIRWKRALVVDRAPE